jgi:predicted SnoaL-like aldol condensation-catalyzing enzyme
MRMVLGTAFMMLAVCAGAEQDQEVRNKASARAFFEDLWFSKNTDRYSKYVADTYVVHDLGERKGVTEPAVTQREIADFFHGFGEISGDLDWQVAVGDLVVTRWFISLAANERARAMGMYDFDRVAVINVFRFDAEGRIVEIWNHRHDPELPQPRDRRPE